MTATFGDEARDKLRTIVARVEHEIAQLPPAGGTAAATELRTSWNELVKTLALGPAPDTRRCPVCGGVGMRNASRCGRCWAALELLAPAESNEKARGES